MICRLCELEKDLVEAHIVATCLHDPLLDPSGPMIHVSIDPQTFPRRSPTGEYDTEILCQSCDNFFSPWENYTANLLMRTDDIYRRTEEAGQKGAAFFEVGVYDYASLKLCLLSILWRMSVSTRPAYKDIQLGPFESVIREMLLKKDPGPTDIFPIYIARVFGYVASSSMIGTKRSKETGINIYNLGLPGYCAIIKVDRRPLPIFAGPTVLDPTKPLTLLLQHLPLESKAAEMANNYLRQRSNRATKR
jgi:hypothetical protein